MSGRKLKEITRRLVHGASDRVYEMIAHSQGDLGWINTAYIERLNATFRARMSSLVRRTRSLAKTVQHLEYELFWSGVFTTSVRCMTPWKERRPWPRG